jgi:hypothetical protein
MRQAVAWWQRACALVAAPHQTLGQARALGTAGSVAVAVGGSFAGSLPAGDPQLAVLGLTIVGGHVDLGVVCVYVGLTMLVAAWWLVGRLVHARPGRGAVPAGVTPSDLVVTLLHWAAPLVLCPPLFSRDVYSYLAQGAMVGAGIDVYANGPASLGGPLAAEVPLIWQHAPAPYGPMFLLYAVPVAQLVGTNTVAGVLGMRAVALLGVAVLALCLPWLARRCGGSATNALWLGVLNPLVLAHLVAGAHNDAVMLGLLVAGLTAAALHRPALGVVLVTLAALVKVPAALGLVFLLPIWARSLRGRWREARAALGAVAVAAVTAVLATTFVGTGFGWVHALGTPASAHNWSLTSSLGRLTGNALEAVGVGVAADAMDMWRLVGLLVAVGAATMAWFQRDRLGPVYALGLALGAIVVLGPALRPWYLLWCVVPLAAAALGRRLRRFLVAACGLLTLVVLPSGFAPDAGDVAQAVLGVGLAVSALLLAGRLAVRPAVVARPDPVPQAAGISAYHR